jgi:glycosyltransferase involved in cell wall biosynthesis
MRNNLRLGLIGSWVPKKCGIATFGRDLIQGMQENDPSIEVFVAAAEEPNDVYQYDDTVGAKLKTDDRHQYTEAAKLFNKLAPDVVFLQHEFGLYGGHWADFTYAGVKHHDPTGDYIFDTIDHLKVPVITTFHTVLPYPDPARKEVTRRIAERSVIVVTMTQDSKRILCADYQIPENRIVVIPHGVPKQPQKNRSEVLKKLGLAEDKYYLVVTGLLSPNKGVDIIINALPGILKNHPEVHLLVVGQTHPQVMAHNDETYRKSLVALAKDLKIYSSVTFINRYLETDELMEYLSASDIYLTIHRDPEQSASGTLAYAVGTDLVTISTPYRYAQEILANGRGFLVPFEDPGAIAIAVNRLIEDRDLAIRTRKNLQAYGREMQWSAVGQAYLKIIKDYVKADYEQPVL